MSVKLQIHWMYTECELVSLISSFLMLADVLKVQPGDGSLSLATRRETCFL